MYTNFKMRHNPVVHTVPNLNCIYIFFFKNWRYITFIKGRHSFLVDGN
jgi:hypothetical protein